MHREDLLVPERKLTFHPRVGERPERSQMLLDAKIGRRNMITIYENMLANRSGDFNNLSPAWTIDR